MVKQASRVMPTLRKLLRPIFLVFPRFRSHRRVVSLGEKNEPVVDMVTTWNKRCGIFAYSAFLMDQLKKKTTLRVVEIQENHALSPYFAVLGAKIGRSNKLVHVQFAYSEFSDLKLWGPKRLSTFSAFLFYGGLVFGNCHVVTTFHELMKEPQKDENAGTLYSKALNKLICNVSDTIIVHAKESKRLMETMYRIDGSKVKIIPMGTPESPKILDKAECKKKLGLSHKKVVVIPGFISRHKGIDLIIQILPKLDPNVCLLISGGAQTNNDLSYRNELMGIAKALDCVDRLIFNDDFPIPAVVLNSADVAILPYTSASESMALRLLVAYQVPTITSDLPIFREISENYGCIALFETNNTSDLLVKTQALLSDERKCQSLREKCKEMWSVTKWSAIAAQHVETYLEVFSAHPDDLYASERQKERLDWLRNNLSGEALEIGCATGYVADYTGATVGVDLNIYRLKLAKTRYHKKDFIISNALYLPFKDKVFNTVLIPEILEHLPIELAEKIVLEAKRTGEKILVTLPNADKINYDRSLVEAPEHVWFPTKDLALKLIKNPKIYYTTENDFMLISA